MLFRIDCRPWIGIAPMARCSKRFVGIVVAIVDMANTCVSRKERAVGICEVTDLLTHEACRDRLPKGVIFRCQPMSI